MSYNVKEFRENLSQHILDLGIDEKFLENPAFASAISDVDRMIGEMNLLDDSERVMVEESKGSFSFNYTSPDGTRYATSIYSMNPNTFSCIKTEDRVLSTTDGSVVQKGVLESVVNLDALGGITIEHNSSNANNLNCESWKCNEITSAERKEYTPDGVMNIREFKSFPEINVNFSINNTNASTMLSRARQGFGAGNFTDSYDTRTFLVRDQFDTAKVKFEDKRSGASYFSVLPLDQRYGLRDMSLNNGAIFLSEVEILPMTKYDAEQIIQKENNPKVAEGLRKIAAGRENYYYNSANDSNFVCNVGGEEKKVAK